MPEEKVNLPAGYEPPSAAVMWPQPKTAPEMEDEGQDMADEIERLRAALKIIQHKTSDIWAETYARDVLLGGEVDADEI